MAHNRLQHIDLRVTDAARAHAFYAKLLPVVGFPTEDSSESWRSWVAEGADTPFRPWFGFTEDRDHRPNQNRIAFAAASREEVDRAARVAREAGARIESGPRDCPEYSATYYAVFFEDPSGNKLEVCHR